MKKANARKHVQRSFRVTRMHKRIHIERIDIAYFSVTLSVGCVRWASRSKNGTGSAFV
jgi:hypothetical protein